jgi:hypothetical protein
MPNFPKIFFVVAALAFSFYPGQSEAASSFRCGVHLVQGGGRHGPSDFEVLRKCGEPSERRGHSWIYRRDNHKWELRFSANGLLQRVTRL